MANAVIGALRANLGLDSAQFEDGLKKSQNALGKFGSYAKTAFVAAAAAATAAIAGMGVAMQRTISDADDLSKAASKIGVPIEELSKLRYAADMSGISFEGLQTGVRKLSQGMNDFATKGTGPAAEAFRRLGIEVENSDGTLKTSTEVMEQIADRFAAMPDGVQKTALAVQLFGKAGADMIPLLNGGSAALREMTDEAAALGLVISEETGKRAEAFNDNLSRLGYAAQGAMTSLMSALLPALVAVTDAVVAAVRGFMQFVDYLPTVIEYATVAGGSLALMVSPQIIAAIYAAAQAIGVALVGAVRALTVAIAANPMAALAIGIAAAITAVYHFRDEIKQAVGVDVVQITKDAANAVIGAFVGAYEGIKAAWALLPTALGDIVIGTANTVIKGIESMVNRAVGKINDFIETINGLVASLPFGAGEGLKVGGIDEVDFGEIANEYAGKAKEAAAAFSGAFAAAQRDYFAGSGGDAATGSLRTAADAASDLQAALDGSGGGGRGGRGGGVSDAAKAAQKALSDMAAEGSRVFEQTRTPLERYQAQIARLNELLKAGKIDQETYSRAVALAQEEFDRASKSAEKSADGLSKVGDTIGNAFSSSFQGLIDGTKKVGDVLRDLLSQLASMWANQAFKALIGWFGGGGRGGGLFGGILSALGFRANGGSVMKGRPYIVGERGPELMVPGANGSVVSNAQLARGSGGGSVDVSVSVDRNGNLQAFVESVSGDVAARTTQAGIGQYDRAAAASMQDKRGRGIR